MAQGASEEAEERDEGPAAGDRGPKAAEEVVAGGARGGGHGLQVCPGRLLDEAVADGDFVAGVAAEGGAAGGLDAGGGPREQVLEGGVGGGLEYSHRDELEID